MMKPWIARALHRIANRVDPPIELRFVSDRTIVLCDAHCSAETVAQMAEISRTFNQHRWQQVPA